MEDIIPNIQDVETVKNKAYGENSYTKGAALDLQLLPKAQSQSTDKQPLSERKISQFDNDLNVQFSN